MKKQLTVNGQKLSVNFDITNIERLKEENGVYLNSIYTFTIDGVDYKVNCSANRNKRSGRINATLEYNGKTFPYSYKKVAEYILEN